MFVSEIIEEVIEILGRSSREKALLRITDAIQALQDEGDWNANLGYADICVAKDGVTVSLPPEIETPLAVAVDCRPAFMRDEFYEFHLNGDGITEKGVPWAWDDKGLAPCFTDIINASEIVAVGQLQSDAGKLVRVLGIGTDGRVLRTQGETGLWNDGISVPVNLLSDFPGGVIALPDLRIFSRIFSPTAITKFLAATAHNLDSGVLMKLAFTSGFASPLLNNGLYYVRVYSPTEVSLHLTRLDAKTNQAPVQIVSTEAGAGFSLTDTRAVEARTKFLSASPITLEDSSQVVFEAVSTPGNLALASPYYIKKEGSDGFLIFESSSLAEAGATPVNVSSVGADVVARSLTAINPSTTLTFNVNHNFSTGDSVTARNSGGSLPEPLLAGVSYYVKVLGAKELSLHSSAANAFAGLNALVLTTPGAGSNSLVKIILATATTGSTSNISAPGHGLNLPSGSGASATAVLTAEALTGFTSIVGGTNYLFPPIVTFTGGGGTGAAATAVVTAGVVTSFIVTAGGSGYTSVPTVVLTPAAGSYVQFSSTGALPEPLEAATVYRAESPMTTDGFTLKDATGNTAINLSSLGSGTLYLNISRAFSVGYNASWKTETTGKLTGDTMRFFVQDGVLPTTTPPIDATTTYHLRVISSGLIEVYDSEVHAEDLAATTGRILIVSMGTGSNFATKDIPVTVVIRDSYLDLEFSGFLLNLTAVTFTTDGTLPVPLALATEYLLAVDSENNFSLLTTAGVPVVLTGVGSGEHNLLLTRNFTVPSASSIEVPNNEFEVGAAVTFSSSDTLPSPLVAGTTYYLRPDGDSVEIFAQYSQAVNGTSLAGRVSMFNIGAGTHKLAQLLPAIKVAKVTAIEKAETAGFVVVYAWDSGNPDSLTLLADMHPREITPSYRRIRVQSRCGSVRMKYRRKSFKVTSERDFINLDSRLAITMMVKSQDLLRKNFYDESERYRLRAVDYLNKRNRALDGPRTSQIQINADVMTVPDDVML
ncbi:MAG: hypothetical protein M0Q93_01275 [Terrimicrobiaceae bacterium]|nr:hypothetical protein [Terrimicrobiaceae bacterium]